VNYARAKAWRKANPEKNRGQKRRNRAIGAHYTQNSGRPWSLREDLLITDPRCGMTDRELGFDLGRTVLAIETRRNRLLAISCVNPIGKGVTTETPSQLLLFFRDQQNKLLTNRVALTFERIETRFRLMVREERIELDNYGNFPSWSNLQIRTRVAAASGHGGLIFVQHLRATIPSGLPDKSPLSITLARCVMRIGFYRRQNGHHATLPDDIIARVILPIRNDKRAKLKR